MDNDLLYQLALTKVPYIGDVHAKMLLHVYGDARSVFHSPKKQLEKIEGIGSVRATAIRDFTDFSSCEDEIRFIEKCMIKPLFYSSEDYPKRLHHCYDSPVMLFYKGNADLNTSRILSVVGTRNNTEYGRLVCEKVIHDLRGSDILIVSGLAFGIDSIAHKAAIKNRLPTVAALAHGLDRIYPQQNTYMAKQMLEHGGLLTDFCSGTKPDKQHFPRRNRITAGICDALLVIESGNTGGSLITAELGNGYNKDVFAIPGRSTDTKSEGCNKLIRQNKAMLITCAEDILDIMNWNRKDKKPAVKQQALFIELNDQEKRVYEILQQLKSAHVDELFFKTGMSSSANATALLNLELHGLISSLPGKMYKLL